MARARIPSNRKVTSASQPDLAAAMMPPPRSLLGNPLAYIAAEHGGQRALCNLIENLAGMPGFDREVARTILRYLGQDFSRHVRDEESDLFPILRERCLPEDEIETVLARLHAEHRDEHSRAGGVEHDLTVLLKQKRPAVDPALRERLFQYARSLRRHLALENSIVLPLARARMTQSDFVKLSTAMRNRLHASTGMGSTAAPGQRWP